MIHTDNITIPRRRAALLPLLLAALMLLSGSSCTRNNGDIGDWFGIWQLMEIRADGEPDAAYGQNIFWSFQNDVLKFTCVGPEGYDRDISYNWGTWKEVSDNTLVFDFTHTDDVRPDIYKPYTVLHFPSDAPFTLTVAESSGKTRTMKYVAADGTEYTYLLHKR